MTAAVTRSLRDALVENRQRAHTHVMSAFPRADDGTSPRAELGVLWHLDPRTSLLTVQSKVPAARAGLLGDVESLGTFGPPAQGSRVAMRLYCNIQKTPPSHLEPELHDLVKARSGAYRSRLVIVPEDERSDWVTRRLERAGLRLEKDSLVVGHLESAHLGGRGQRIPAAEIQVNATIHDQTVFAEALTRGIGRGRNYGLGLVRLHALED